MVCRPRPRVGARLTLATALGTVFSSLPAVAVAQDPEPCPPPAGEAQQQWRGRSLDEWRDLIAPKPEELAWQRIPWRASFWSALHEAREQQKPILLWAMNGHPLGCT